MKKLHLIFGFMLAVGSSLSWAAPYCNNAATDPDGDGWGWENNQSCVVQFKGFKVNGSVLNDANGNRFIARGINNPHAWFDSQSFSVLGNLASRRTNIIRVVWTTSGNPTRLDQIITEIRNKKMVAMVELHDGTGSNSASVLQNMANYWARADVVSVLKKHERYLLLNIANEWSDGNKTPYQWKEDYKNPITTIRNTGITTTIVIDNPGWGQNANGALWNGWDLLNHDPRHNLMFAIHMYGSWNNSNDISTAMNNYNSNGLALVIGEFGYNYNNGNNNLGCKVDANLLMQYAQNYGIGYIAWSTQGNDSSNAWLDLMTGWSGTTSWGNTVWYSQYGIYNTAKTASIY